MHTKESLKQDLMELGIDPEGTLLVHSSMKSIGAVEGRADTVLDALSEHMEEGLLILPTHTWSYIHADNPKYYVETSPSCVGILTELFRKRPNVYRSYHPTHSVAALGRKAEEFVKGDEQFKTPCDRGSAWGRLLDEQATIMMIGVDLIRNTFIHGIEEWNDIPGRLSDAPQPLVSVLPDGTEMSVPSFRHHGARWSLHFWKVDELLQRYGAMKLGTFGDAEVRICDAIKTDQLITEMLTLDPELFSDIDPLTDAFVERYHTFKRQQAE